MKSASPKILLLFVNFMFSNAKLPNIFCACDSKSSKLVQRGQHAKIMLGYPNSVRSYCRFSVNSNLLDQILYYKGVNGCKLFSSRMSS